MAALTSIAAGATIAAGAASVGSGIASIFSGNGSGGQKLELPPELEPGFLENYASFLTEAQTAIDESKAQIPYLEKRIAELDRLAQLGTPKPEDLQALNQIDLEIAQRFGKSTSADVKAGIITDEAKKQTMALQQQLRAELENQGINVDDKLSVELQQLVRNRLSSGSRENMLLEEVGKSLIDELKRNGEPIPEKDPRVENQLKAQEDAVRAKLRSQFGPDYENTTQGRRALNDFYQGATETRFSVAQELKKAASEAGVARIQRLSAIGQTASGLVTTSNQTLASNVDAARGASDIANARVTRLSNLGQAIGVTADNALKATEVDRQRELLDIQRAQVAQQSGQNLRGAYQAGIEGQAAILKLSEIPNNLRNQVLATKAGTLEAAAKLGQFKFSGLTKDLLSKNQIAGIPGRMTPRNTNTGYRGAYNRNGQPIITF